MKKLIFGLMALVFTLTINAQNQSSCSSLFAYTLNGNTVSYIPAVLGDSGLSRHLWYLGDGRVSDMRTPVITNAQCGTYTVKHVFKVLNAAGVVLCADSTTLPVVIPCQQWCELTANFNFSVLPASNGTTTVNFTNASTNLLATDSCFWNFGDGTTGIGVNPSHTYPTNGVYAVCLRVKRNPPTAGLAPCIREICKPVAITNINSCSIRPSFVKVPSPTVPLRALFTNTTPVLSANTATAQWIFGDGTTATTWNAEHTYPAPGRYRVCLKVFYGNNCVSDICDSVTIEQPRVIRCDSVVVRMVMRREPTQPTRVFFSTTNNAPITQETWTITPTSGQNVQVVTYNQINPVHTFTAPGSYRVCLRAVTLGNCVKEMCDTLQVGANANLCELTAFPNPAQSQVSVYVNLTQPRMITAVLFNSQFTQVGSISQWGAIGNNQVSFNIGALPAGPYIIRITAGDRICFARFAKM